MDRQTTVGRITQLNGTPSPAPFAVTSTDGRLALLELQVVQLKEELKQTKQRLEYCETAVQR
jgi:hypothetical protein